MSRLVIAAVATLMVITTGGIVGAQGVTLGEPEINVYLPENEVSPGSDAELTLHFENDAEVISGDQTELVTTARAVNARITDEGPFDVLTGTQPVGPISDGAVSQAAFQVVVPHDIEPGSYDIDVRIQYSVTNQVTSDTRQRLTRTRTRSVSVQVVDDPRFAITDVDTAVQPGTTGTAALTVENVGSETANATRGTFTGGEGVQLDGGTAEAFIGDLEPNDTRTVNVDVAVEETVAAGAKPIEAAFAFRDAAGRDREARTTYGTLSTLDAQSLTIEDLGDTLAVGYEGEIRGTLHNDGPRSITDGVLVVDPASESLIVEEARYALPPLEPGDSTAFTFPTDVSGSALPGPRQVRFSVEYAHGGQTTTTTGPISKRVIVDNQQAAFNITAADARLPAGETTTVALTIRNDRPETLSNVNARLYTDSPLSASSDEAFIDRLAPGTTADVEFTVSAAEGAMAKPYPLELDFQYDTERGDTTLSRTYQYPINVTESSEGDGSLGGPSILVGLTLLTTLLVGYRARHWPRP